MSTRLTNFAGLASLPVIRDELVVRRHVLTDDKLNEAVVITRSTPGPAGLYVVSSCYFAGDAARAIAGWLAMITPELLILPLLRFAAGKAEHPRLRLALRYGRRKRRAPAGRRRASWSGRSYRAGDRSNCCRDGRPDGGDQDRVTQDHCRSRADDSHDVVGRSADRFVTVSPGSIGPSRPVVQMSTSGRWCRQSPAVNAIRRRLPAD